MTHYERIDHTADFGIRVFAEDGPALFVGAAMAMVEQIVDKQRLRPSRRVRVEVTGADWADLMVEWLRELLFLVNGRELLVCSIRILTLEAYRVSADIEADPFDPARHRIKGEIKAVTYHQIRVEPGPSGWEAAVIFDV
jgi:SHS2 domain-containing protein